MARESRDYKGTEEQCEEQLKEGKKKPHSHQAEHLQYWPVVSSLVYKASGNVPRSLWRGMYPRIRVCKRGI